MKGEDEGAFAFLDGYPRAYGYFLAAPKEHRAVTGDFTMKKYIRAPKARLPRHGGGARGGQAGRMYINTFGSNEGNFHVHWLARRAVAAQGALRGAAGQLDSLEQGCAQDIP
jgi:hypothetical protein